MTRWPTAKMNRGRLINHVLGVVSFIGHLFHQSGPPFVGLLFSLLRQILTLWPIFLNIALSETFDNKKLLNHSSLKTISLFLLFNFKSTYCCRIMTKISFYTKIWTRAGYVKVSARNKILLTLKLQEISTFIHGSSVRSLLLFLPKLIERSFVKLLHCCFHAKRQEWMVFCHFFVYLTENVGSMVQTHWGDLVKPISGNKKMFFFLSNNDFKTDWYLNICIKTTSNRCQQLVRYSGEVRSDTTRGGTDSFRMKVHH